MSSKRRPIKGAQDAAVTAAQVEPTPRVKALTAENAELRTRIEGLKQETGQAEVILAAVLDAAQRIAPLPTTYQPPRKSTRVTHPCEAVLVLTDWHVGKTVDAAEVLGENSFDFARLRERLLGDDGLVTRKVQTVDLERSNIRIDTLRVFCLGDMVNGNLREEDNATNEFSEAEQPIRSGALLAECLAALAPCFERVIVDYVVPDNHSRLTKKISHKQPWNSWNYIVAKYAEAMTERLGNVEWRIHPGEVAEVEVCGMRYLLRHGHDMTKGTGGFGGLPFYGFERAAGLEARKRMRIPEKVVFDRLIFGHFHTYGQGPDWRVCPSPSGTDNFDHSQGRYARPAQVGWLVHPKRGEMNLNLYELD